MTDKNLKKALELIDKESFNEAEKLLLKLRRNSQTPYINYLLGYIHHVNLSAYSFSENEDKFKGSKEDAKRFLGYSIDSDNPIEDAFCRLADIEENKKHAVRILKKGLEYFPNSKIIYEYLIIKSENSDIPLISKEIESKNIVSNKIYFKLYEFFLSYKCYDEALKQLKKIKVKNKNEEQLLSLIKAFGLFELSEIEKAKSIFKKLINDDVNQNLNYAQYIGLLLCFFKTKDINQAITLIKELPNKFDDLFVWIHSDFYFHFGNYFNDSIEQFSVLFKAKKEQKEAYAKLRGIKALKLCEFERANKKTILDLKFARNNLENKEIFDTELVTVYLHTDQIIEAFEQDLRNVIEYSNYESELNYILDDISKKDLKTIVDLFIKKLNTTSSWQRDKYKKIMEGVISALCKNENYENITKVSSYFSEDVLERTDVLFELAFAYSKTENETRAKKYYEKIWGKGQISSAVANNLALLYKDEGDWIHAKELFEKAVKLDSNDDTAKNNLQRLINKIEDEEKDIERWEKEQKEVIDNIKNENIYIHQRISYLIDAEDKDRNIVASYSQLSGILKAIPEKVQELVKNFLKKNYITKVQNHNINTLSNVYRVNHLVREFVLKRKKRIEENKLLSVIGERINIDSFENLGFDKHLLSEVDSKISDITLREILKRDLKENIFSLLTDSYKTALVLSGSITESFILNKVLDSGITIHSPNSYAKKRKKVIDMNLSELLFTANENKIIEFQLYHFSQALKQYRNFIHPAVEIRKGKTKKISERDAKLAWEITKKIIFEI
ncbi:hypothetical protein ES705_00898 [subsurface metagenome]|nr:hypothetical protein [Clostridia bacterium]